MDASIKSQGNKSRKIKFLMKLFGKKHIKLVDGKVYISDKAAELVRNG